MVTVAILSVALYTTERLERWMNPSQTDPPLLFGDTALNSLAIICAEGKILLLSHFTTINTRDVSPMFSLFNPFIVPTMLCSGSIKNRVSKWKKKKKVENQVNHYPSLIPS
jgi:hypothetical protein